VSPHGPVDFNQFTINDSPTLAGHFYNFGDFQTELVFKNDLESIEQIKNTLTYFNHDRGSFKINQLPFREINLKELDHGALVPLYYLSREYPKFKVVPIAYSYLDIETHFKFGKILKKAIESQDKKIAIVASGDLSHRLTPEAPAGYSSRGKEFDEKLIELLKNKDVKGILNMDPDLVEEAGECGYRSIIILLGVLDGLNWQPEILSYEGPFGVGYLVANFKI
ncbi:MAG TPA: AmmeMemoRadiSam system protein B, partial [Candidatus Atribacteria bacterium]|nr:AmmeMemoRadiSam system protein B [Candidatus Atribacteria bacterium]